MKPIFTTKPGLDGKRIRLTTNVDSDIRVKARIIDTPYYLSLPYTIGTFAGELFNIGHVRFKRTSNNTVKALDPIPASWFVDLSIDVVEDYVQLQLAA
jgi:hypothetical protein